MGVTLNMNNVTIIYKINFSRKYEEGTFKKCIKTFTYLDKLRKTPLRILGNVLPHLINKV